MDNTLTKYYNSLNRINLKGAGKKKSSGKKKKSYEKKKKY